MTQTPGIVITGGSGRMGQMLIKSVLASDKCRLVGVLERSGHDWIGQDVGTMMGGQAAGVTVTDDAVEVFAKAQAVIDFTSPAATVGFAGLAAQARAVHVIGTTGLSADDLKAINAASRHAVIVRAGNMSLGVNLLVQLTRQVAAALDEAGVPVDAARLHHLAVACNAVIDGLWMEGGALPGAFEEGELPTIGLESVGAILGLNLQHKAEQP